MNYQEAVEYIHHCSHVGGRAGMKRILPLTEKLGFPQRKMKFVHIAGSSGKGSTAAMTESVLRNAGFKTGLYMSPYVYDFRERLQINGQLPDGQLIADALESMIPALDEMKREGRECTEFEVLTALAFTLFAREGCEWTALEVGIGGRHDVTNVIDPPCVAAICNIGLDHTKLLGSTITEIATEKCGIIKEGSRVAAYCDLPADAQAVLDSTCAEFGVKPKIIRLSDISDLSVTQKGSSFDYKGQHYEVSMIGLQMVKNALNVIGISEELAASGVNITPEIAARGIKETKVVGRFEIVNDKPLCVIDGAHNPDKVASVCETIDALYKDKRIISVFGMQKKKDYRTSIPQIAKRSDVFIATLPHEVAEPVPAEESSKIAENYCPNVIVCEDPEEAGRLARSMAGEDDMVVACGSIYLAADAKRGIIR